MDIKQKSKEILEKLRALPDNKKKIIVFGIGIAVLIILGLFWFNITVQRISKLSDINIEENK